MTSVANGHELVYRHSAVIRLTHWVAVLCVTLLFLSGLQIFNAHPSLYLGQRSDFARPITSIGAAQKENRAIGVTKIFGFPSIPRVSWACRALQTKTSRLFHPG